MGLPALLVIDQGTYFMSETFCKTLKKLNISHKTNSPYHHESNGEVERASRTIKELISLAIGHRNHEWVNIMFLTIHVYNCAKNSSTKHSSHTVLHGFEPSSIFRNSLELPHRNFAGETGCANQLTLVLRSTTFYDPFGNPQREIWRAPNVTKTSI